MKNWQLFVYRKKDIASLKGITAAGRGKWIWSAVTEGTWCSWKSNTVPPDAWRAPEAVDRVKQKRIRAAAVYYMFSHKIPEDCPCRFDVVGILGDQVELIQDAF